MFQTTRRQETGKKLSVVETDESAKLMETAGTPSSTRRLAAHLNKNGTMAILVKV